MSKSSKKVLFQVTGSIACYKSCLAISTLVQKKFEVQVVASPAALQFVGAATFEGLTGKRIFSDIYEPGFKMDHIQLARWADILVLAPATANTLNRLATGLADDAIGTLFLSNNFKKPYLIAPAMNTEMYQHPATRQSLKILADWGATILNAPAGALACGEIGPGRLVEPEILIQAIQRLLDPKVRRSTK